MVAFLSADGQSAGMKASWRKPRGKPKKIVISTICRRNGLRVTSTIKIFGVEILNEGSGASSDDAVTEMQATFVARYVEPWTAAKGPDSASTLVAIPSPHSTPRPNLLRGSCPTSSRHYRFGTTLAFGPNW